MPFMFENLKVYQRAVDLADRVVTASRRFPRGYYFLVDQMSRASLSVAANLAEGNGRNSKAERKHFFTIARGSLQECVPLLEIARRQQLLSEAQVDELRGEINTIGKMLAGLISGIAKRKP